MEDVATCRGKRPKVGLRKDLQQELNEHIMIETHCDKRYAAGGTHVMGQAPPEKTGTSFRNAAGKKRPIVLETYKLGMAVFVEGSFRVMNGTYGPVLTKARSFWMVVLWDKVTGISTEIFRVRMGLILHGQYWANPPRIVVAHGRA